MIGRLRGLKGIVLRFDDGAQAYRDELEAKHLSLQACETVDPKLASHFGKYDGAFARLCVVFHCVENAMMGVVPFASVNTCAPVSGVAWLSSAGLCARAMARVSFVP